MNNQFMNIINSNNLNKKAQRAILSKSFNSGSQTLEEATKSGIDMITNLKNNGKLLFAPKKKRSQ